MKLLLNNKLVHNQAVSKQLIHSLLPRKNKIILTINDVIIELHIQLLEATIMLQTIQSFQTNKLFMFDSLIGDRKCQTRTSMLIDFLQNNKFISTEFITEIPKINLIISKIKKLLLQITSANYLQKKQIIKELKTLTLSEYLNKNHISLNSSCNLERLSFFFFTALNENQIQNLSNNMLSKKQIHKILEKTKIKLCDLSIEYEKNLSLMYGSTDEQKVLQQIESKGFCSMTAFFPSFKSIFTKMKQLEQSFITKTIIFCACGGIQKNKINLFTPKNKRFVKISLPKEINEAITVVEAYQFPGSLNELKNILNVPTNATKIPKEYFKLCYCAHRTKQTKIDSIETAIMAVFAQHPQFTNGAQIDFEGLGLTHSDLKKEYEHLLTLKGFSRNDMSKFHINHIYPSTIAEVLEQHKEIAEKIIPVKAASVQNRPIVS